MSLSRLARKRKVHCNGNGGKEDHFDLLGLPDEMIDRVFSFLDLEDGMRMRMNERLNKIESMSKYYVGRVLLDQSPIDSKCVIIRNRNYPLDYLARIAQNASIGRLHVFLRSSVELRNQFVDLIKEFRNIRSLVVYIRDDDSGQLNEIMSDSLFLDLTGRCNKLELKYFTRTNLNISSEAVHQVYKNMNDGSTSLRKLIFNACLGREKLNAFLILRGIAYRNGRIISSRNIEAYKDLRDSSADFYVNIFDGFFHISFFAQLRTIYPYSFFKIELHENLESLKNSKNDVYRGWKRTRMDFYSE